MPPTADVSPWRRWRQDRLRELLPPPPPAGEIEELLRVARDEEASGHARAHALATAIVQLQRWYEEFAAAAYAAEATDGATPEEIMAEAEAEAEAAAAAPAAAREA